MSAFYVTTPIYYVNDYPHIGHMYTTIVADVVARYRRLAGDDTHFLTGTDEHGQNIERASRELGIEPIEQANRVAERCRELWDELAISHDDFIRTTEPRHHAGVREMIERIAAAGDFYVGKHEGWYCSSCETFYTDKELGPDHACPVHERPTEWKSEENVFFRLSKYEQPLLDLYRNHPEFVRPESRLNEVRSFVEGGLKDLSVSRADLEWGIPFPDRPGQTVYVWLDALTNYISALGFGGSDRSGYEKYWEGSGEGGGESEGEAPFRLQLVGKDILRFHAVYWPAFLLCAGLPLPDTVFAHGWWLRDQKKVSKSVGNVVRPDALIERFGADTLRFYLLREMVFGQDASFSDEAFIDRYNSDLANDLGNTVSRLVTLARRAYDGRTPPVDCDDNDLKTAAQEAIATYRREMDDLAFHKALDALWKLLSETNQYFVEREPWKLIKSDPESERLSRILWNGLEATRLVAVGLLPVMPRVAPQVLAALGFADVLDGGRSLDEEMVWGKLPTSALLPEPQPLFPRIDKDEYLGAATIPGETPAETPPAPKTEPEKKPKASKGPKASMEDSERLDEIDIETFFKTELRVGTVVSAEPVPKSNKLMKLMVRLSPGTPIDEGDESGESEGAEETTRVAETRQIVAGIAKAYDADELVGQQVVVVANLKPAKLMGVESQGMVLAASEDGKPVLVRPVRGVPDGTRVR